MTTPLGRIVASGITRGYASCSVTHPPLNQYLHTMYVSACAWACEQPGGTVGGTQVIWSEPAHDQLARRPAHGHRGGTCNRKSFVQGFKLRRRRRRALNRQAWRDAIKNLASLEFKTLQQVGCLALAVEGVASVVQPFLVRGPVAGKCC
eukprot:355986-Chlamydomonas_euryale.AAC.15